MVTNSGRMTGENKNISNKIRKLEREMQMSNREKLIAALENAEEKELEVEFSGLTGNGTKFTFWMVPEIMISENELQVWDAESGNSHYFSFLIRGDVIFDDETEEYVIHNDSETLIIRIS